MPEVAIREHTAGDDTTPTTGTAEQKTLRISVVGNVFFALLGLGFGISTGSEAILLDGYFSLVAFVMALVTLRVARMVLRPEDEDFHFGYFAFEPLVNIVKGLLTIGVCALAFAAAVGAMLHGGRDIDVGGAVFYSVLATLGASLMAVMQARTARKTGSALLQVDSINWRIDAILSVVVTAAFALTLLLQRSPWSDLVPYVDPGLVIVLILAVVLTPARIVRDGLADLLLLAPGREEQQTVKRRFEEIVAPYSFTRTHLRMMRVGRASYALAHIVVAPDFEIDGVTDLDAIRRQISQALGELDPPWTVDTLFVADDSLVDT